MKKIDFIIFYEHIAREFDSVALLHSYMSFLGFSGVVLPVHFNRYKYVLKYKPKIIVMPYYYSKYDVFDNYLKLYPDTILINLHSEQISSKLSAAHMLPNDEKTRNVLHCVWGENFAKQLVESGVDKSKIFITGSIRNDLTYFLLNKNKESSNIILVPTSFSLSFLDKNETDDLVNIFKDKDRIEELIAFTKKSRDSFFKRIYKFSQLIKTDSQKILLRPHPHVSLSEYEKKFCEVNGLSSLPDNIIINRNGSIQENIAECSKLIAWNSTSALEAAMMNKKVVLLVPYAFPNFMDCDFLYYFPIANDAASLQKYLIDSEIDSGVKSYLYNTYYEIDGKTHVRIGKLLSDCIASYNDTNDRRIGVVFYFFIKYILYDIPKNILHRLGVLGKLYPHYRGILMDNKIVDSPAEYTRFLSNNMEVKYESNDFGSFIKV